MAARLAATEERERQFLMSVSHELRTPLTAIKGHVDALRDGLVDDPEWSARRSTSSPREAIRLERLVGDVLDLAKLNAHRFTVHARGGRHGRLVEQAYASFGEEARRREIEYRLREDRRAADDRHRRRPRAAGDHQPARQRVPLDARRRQRSSSRSRARTATVRVDVADTGPGIRPEERERIFRPFISRDNARTGLGPPDRPRARACARRPDRARLDGRRGEPLHAGVAGRDGREPEPVA